VHGDYGGLLMEKTGGLPVMCLHRSKVCVLLQQVQVGTTPGPSKTNSTNFSHIHFDV
jgi:hypothetical protein